MSDLEDVAIAVDATFFIHDFLDRIKKVGYEPLLPALGGLTAFEDRIEKQIGEWLAHGITPFFIFDGLSVVGQDAMETAHGIEVADKCAEAWEVYWKGDSAAAVGAFGSIDGRSRGADESITTGTMLTSTAPVRPQTFYPALKKILHRRKLHFLVAPYNAAAQVWPLLP